MMNHFLQSFGLQHPVIQGPMGGVAGPELVAAVANAGGLGVLPIWQLSVRAAVAQIEATQVLTKKPFAVNLRADLVQHAHIEAALNAGVKWLHLFWGDPYESVRPFRNGKEGRGDDIQLISTVGDVDAAQAAIAAGASVLVAQGVEAGGHVFSEQPLEKLLDSVLALAREAGEVPVIAAGGCVNGDDAHRLISSGAAGVLLGTRFVASAECAAHPEFKQALIDAGPNSTVRSQCFDDGWSNAPHRTLNNQTLSVWQAAGEPEAGARPGEGDSILRTAKGTPVARYSVTPPAVGMGGDIRESALYAGIGAERIETVLSAAEIIAEVSAGIRR